VAARAAVRQKIHLTHIAAPVSRFLQRKCGTDSTPVYRCQHTDPNYSNSNHGWPQFAGNMSWETFSKY
jgi:hypothetical protein